jgi:hypothetical protein
VKPGDTFTFQAQLYPTTIKGNSSESITLPSASGANTVALVAGGTLMVVAYASGWIAMVDAVGSGSFPASLAANGYEKKPNGVIRQWGQATSSGSGDVTVTFPIAFPTAVVAIKLTVVNATTGNYTTCVGGPSLSGFPMSVFVGSTGSRSVQAVYFEATGY